MIGFIKNLLKPKEDFEMLISDGATIVDVRTHSEYERDHVKDSVNIPLDTLPGPLVKMKKDSAIILCCASGLRSSIACSTLVSMGYKHVYDGGSCENLKKYKQ